MGLCNVSPKNFYKFQITPCILIIVFLLIAGFYSDVELAPSVSYR